MIIQDINVNQLYTSGDAIYEVIYVHHNYSFCVVIHYSRNHHVYNVETWMCDDFVFGYLEEEDPSMEYLFDDIDLTKLN